MKKVMVLSILVVAFMSFNSCRKSIQSSNKDLVGTWDGEYTTLIIRAIGTGDYDFYDGYVKKSIHGNVKIKGEQIIFSAGFITKRYSITQRPKTENGMTYMILDGEKFYN